MTPTALILTHSGDFFVPERVAEELERRGARALRVDTDRYPTGLPMALGLRPDGQPAVRLDGLDCEVVSAVYARRTWAAALPEELDPGAQAAIRAEVKVHWRALEDLLADRRWVNPPAAEAAVEGHKLHQLQAAARAGLRVPDTLVTNDPAAARAFCARHGDDVVVKLLAPLSVSMSGAAPRVPTTALGPDDMDHLDDLALGPMCLQPRLRAREELRVAWVNGRCFAGAIGGAERPDWRLGHDAWRPGALDADTEAALGRLMRGLGLCFGAVDLLVPADGAPVFLEVNPSGEWGMLEHALGLPIAAALADALLETP